MITYTESTHEVTAQQLHGFFVGWPIPPSAETHLRILRGSDFLELAVDDEAHKVVGFITATTDGVLSAYIPLLEVIPDYRGRGIGSELLRTMLTRLSYLYMVDLLCEPELQSFYSPEGMRPAVGMAIRHYGRQSGAV
jgi:ribosomal protein S18 acetylase RimI-like enzyme